MDLLAKKATRRKKERPAPIHPGASSVADVRKFLDVFHLVLVVDSNLNGVDLLWFNPGKMGWIGDVYPQ